MSGVHGASVAVEHMASHGSPRTRSGARGGGPAATGKEAGAAAGPPWPQEEAVCALPESSSVPCHTQNRKLPHPHRASVMTHPVV